MTVVTPLTQILYRHDFYEVSLQVQRRRLHELKTMPPPRGSLRRTVLFAIAVWILVTGRLPTPNSSRSVHPVRIGICPLPIHDIYQLNKLSTSRPYGSRFACIVGGQPYHPRGSTLCILKYCLSGVAESDLVEGVTELGRSTTPQEQALRVDGSSTAVLQV